jgi:hypothetical protein
MYNLDIDSLVFKRTPPDLRLPKYVAWMQNMLSPMQTVNADFVSTMNGLKEELSINGQTMILEWALNQKWPAAGGGILIDNTPDHKPRYYIFGEDENQGFLGYVRSEDEGFPPLIYLYGEEEYEVENDFTVKVPASLDFDTDEMKAFINKYKLADKRYKIETY